MLWRIQRWIVFGDTLQRMAALLRDQPFSRSLKSLASNSGFRFDGRPGFFGRWCNMSLKVECWRFQACASLSTRCTSVSSNRTARPILMVLSLPSFRHLRRVKVLTCQRAASSAGVRKGDCVWVSAWLFMATVKKRTCVSSSPHEN